MPLATTNLNEILEQSPHLKGFLSICKSHGVMPYLVGGAVRDLLFKGKLSEDLDIVVPTAMAKALANEAAEKLDGKCICLDEHFNIYRVILFPSLTMLDIAGCIGKDIHEDLLRRDLTVNAIGYDLTNRTLLDPTGGQQDLEQGVLRQISEKNMLEDPLRLLRVFRIGAELGFTRIDPDTLATLNAHSEKVIRSAPERIHYELMKLFSAPTCYTHIRTMAQTGMLEHIFPEISAMHPIPANTYHHLGLLDHTLELLNQAEEHYADLPPDIQAHLQSQFNPFIKNIAVARMACLLHDIGKPATMAYIPETNRYTFYQHEEVSEQLTLCIAQRLKWGKDMTKVVAALVRWHLYPADMLKPETTSKAHRKFFNRIGWILPEMMVLAIADRFSAKGPAISPEELEAYKAGLLQLWDQYLAYQTTMETKPKILSGEEIMKLLEIPPGPRVGEILAELNEARLNEELSSKDEAIAWVKQNYGKGN